MTFFAMLAILVLGSVSHAGSVTVLISESDPGPDGRSLPEIVIGPDTRTLDDYRVALDAWRAVDPTYAPGADDLVRQISWPATSQPCAISFVSGGVCAGNVLVWPEAQHEQGWRTQVLMTYTRLRASVSRGRYLVSTEAMHAIAWMVAEPGPDRDLRAERIYRDRPVGPQYDCSYLAPGPRRGCTLFWSRAKFYRWDIQELLSDYCARGDTWLAWHDCQQALLVEDVVFGHEDPRAPLASRYPGAEHFESRCRFEYCGRIGQLDPQQLKAMILISLGID